MNEPRSIRVFYSEDQADQAAEMLNKAGFQAYVKEDKFGRLRLPDLGMRARYRLFVERKDVYKVAEYMAKELKKSKT